MQGCLAFLTIRMETIRAVCLFSGGLDSILAVRILEAQGIDVQAVTCVTPFFGSTYLSDSASLIEKAARRWQIDLKVVDITRDYFPMLKSPPHGYGKNFNPCIDCKILMLRKAREIMESVGARFVATGEVIGQRPMSQRRDTMRIVERDSGLGGLLLRPLSAKLLPESLPEREGWVDRARLFNLSGRSRAHQMALARTFRIDSYPSPAGGCILTDPVLSKRIEYMLQRHDEVGPDDISLCRLGRHFVWPEGSHLIIARNETENALLEALQHRGQVVLKVENFPGPLGLYLEAREDQEDGSRLITSAEIISRYSKARHESVVEVLAKVVATGEKEVLTVSPRWELEGIGCRRI